MILSLPTKVAQGYKSASQKARVMTEAWALTNMYCPACISNRLKGTPTGTEAIDFVCPRCDSNFQLKAMSKTIGRKILDAGYDAMMRAMLEDRLPNFVLLSYCRHTLAVNDLVLIPRFCLGSSAIEARKPLRSTARRAGWVGCNIVLDLVPPEGRIRVVRSGIVVPRTSVRKAFQRVKPLGEVSSKKRGWTLDVLTSLRSLEKQEFTLGEVYSFEDILARRHPENRHVRAKIRQQLQMLRDLGYLRFIERGRYAWV